ncbi:mannosyltransferase [Rhodococcus rhodnii]|uniref:Mannosyltransferase n=1 Tax=Rhodococcus rhodnii TaxID=38312 RepID=A0A6P2CKM2_9NOCA|nr:mannosyltransferase [Rhodococcus rhodnii]
MAPAPSRRGRDGPRFLGFAVPAAVFVVGTLVGFWSSWVPSFWYDEAATVRASTRSTGDLWRMLGNIDAVHGAYYLLMHVWFGVFGVSELSARLPSALAVGAAAAGVAVLGRRFGGTRTAVVAAALCVVTPRLTWAAVEARGYALSAAVAVWATVAVVAAVCDRSRWWLWLLYAAAIALGTVVFVYSSLLVLAHAVTLLWLRTGRRLWAWWTGAVVLAGAATAAFVRVVVAQTGQVSWIPPLDRSTVRTVAQVMWFPGAPLAAVLAAVLIVAAVVVRIRGGRRFGAVVAVTVPWLVVPPAALLVLSAVHDPTFLARYPTFTAPAVGLLLGGLVTTLTRRWWSALLVVAVFAAAAAPAYLEQRTAFAKPSGMDFSAVGRFLDGRVEPGDCVVFGSAAWNPASQRLVAIVHPHAFEGARDIGLRQSADETGWLWDIEIGPTEQPERYAACDVVWFVADEDRDVAERIRHETGEVWDLPAHHILDDPAIAVMRDTGLEVRERWPIHVTQVVLLTRGTEAR